MIRPVALLVAASTVLAAGMTNGILDGRWEPTIVVALDETLPERLPSWDACAPDPLEGLVVSPKSGESARIVMHYVHRTNSKKVSVLLIYGDAVTMLYNPYICYQGNGYINIGETAHRRSVPGTADMFWERDFAKGADTTHLRVRWACSADGFWHAPNTESYSEVTKFHLKRNLFKLYVVSSASPDQPLDADPTIAFLSEFATELRATLPH